MKFKVKLVVTVAVIFFSIQIYLFYYSFLKESTEETVKSDLDQQDQRLQYRSGPSKGWSVQQGGRYQQEIVIILISCVSRFKESLNAMKSAITFSRSPLRLIIFTEENFIQTFRDTLESWKTWKNSFRFELHLTTYPKSEDAQIWRELVVPCASQRLFLPSVLTDVEAALFVDTDVLFMSPVEEIWDLFTKMNATQEVAMAREVDFPHGGFYEVMAKHPYYQPGGLNAGVVLMNMTRMRASHWTREIVQYYHQYKQVLLSGDQDLINIYFYHHPDRVLVMSARYNFRPHNCNLNSVAYHQTSKQGVAILHGTGSKFHMNVAEFMAVYNFWSQFVVGANPKLFLHQPLKYFLETSKRSQCRDAKGIFYKGIHSLNNPRSSRISA